MSTKEGSTRIEQLTEENFGSWFVDIRAELRSEKLWKYTQELYESEDSAVATTAIDGEIPKSLCCRKEQKAIKDWEEKSQEAADLMTPTISPGVKQKLTEAEFNDGYLMLTRLRTLLQPTGFSEFMRLSKEYYTLQYKAFKFVPEYLTHIEILEAKIDATKVILDTNTRTILCLSMSLPQEYQYLVQIWAVTPSITAEKARQMVLEASRQHNQALFNSRDPALAFRPRQEKEKCKHCGFTGRHSVTCFIEHPELAPDWFKEKMKDLAKKSTGKDAERARIFQVNLAMALRGDDFEDSGTRISA